MTLTPNQAQRHLSPLTPTHGPQTAPTIQLRAPTRPSSLFPGLIPALAWWVPTVPFFLYYFVLIALGKQND